MDFKFMEYLNDLDKNPQYEKYLDEHINAVQNAYGWMKQHLPEILDVHNYAEETAYYGELDEIIAKHDQSKYRKVPDADNYYELTPEYDAYANYFYGKQTQAVKDAFDRAWLAHIHANPHHWQHWVLVNDDDGSRALEMPKETAIEMICDWMSFSIKVNKLNEVLEWYDNHKKTMILHKETKKFVEDILDKYKKIIKEL